MKVGLAVLVAVLAAIALGARLVLSTGPQVPTPPLVDLAVHEEVVPFEPPDPDVRDLLRPRAGLRILLVNADTGEPATGALDLWRLGIPGDPEWTEGDERVGVLRVPVDGVLIEGLEPGRYRVHLRGQRIGPDDPPAFELPAGRSETVCRTALPRKAVGHLVVLDEEGNPLREARRRHCGLNSYGRGDDSAAWARPRTRRGSDTSRIGVGGCGGGPGWSRIREVRAEEEGFLLGAYLEATRTQSLATNDWFWFEGRNRVFSRLTSDAGPRPVLLALAVRRERLLAGVTLPDGQGPLEAGAIVDFWCDAVLRRDGDATDAWRRIPIRVEIDAPRCRPLSYDFRLDDPVVPRRMEALEGDR